MSFNPSSNSIDDDDAAALLWTFVRSTALPATADASSSTLKPTDEASALLSVLHRANAAQSPATRLYSHALESIFGFCSLVDLLSAAATHREWRRAVPKMRCLRSTLQLRHFTRQLHTVWPSQVAPHIIAIEPAGDAKNAELDTKLLAQLALHMPQLESLSCEMIVIASMSALVWPARLRSLTVSFPSGPHVTLSWLLQTQDTLLRSLASLSLLESLDLRFPAHSKRSDFSLLHDCKSLRSLSWSWRDGSWLSEHQLQALTRLPTLRRLRLPSLPGQMKQLLAAASGPLPWTSVASTKEKFALDFDELAGAFVNLLPHLTELNAQFIASLEGLSRLTELTSLSLSPRLQSFYYDPYQLSRHTLSTDVIVTAVSSCAGLTSLVLRQIEFNDEQMRTLLSRLLALRSLVLASSSLPSTLDTICASAPALHRLELIDPVPLLSAEPVIRGPELLAPLLSMRWLEECKLVRFVNWVQAAQWYSEVQQSQRLPRLTKFAAPGW